MAKPAAASSLSYKKGMDRDQEGVHVKPAFKKVCVIGLGYVGLPTAALIACRDMEVIGVDINSDLVDTVNRGDIPIVEPDLDVIVRGAVATGNLRATMTAEPADVFIFAVPTPFRDGNQPDLSYVEQAARKVASVLEKGNLVILESTSPIGATAEMAKWMAEERPELTFPQDKGENADIRVAYCPERILPGHVLRELVENDRVIGGLTPLCAQHATAFYNTFVTGSCMETDAATAEMVKLVENSSRDVNIAFANELSIICDKLDVNVWTVIEMANHHPRINILQPGPGVGGHCIAVDPWFIVASAPKEARLIRMAREINDGKTIHVVEKVKTAAESFQKPCIACFGLAYKPDIDDLRESPSVRIVEKLADLDIEEILVVEPFISELPKQLSGRTNLRLVDADEALGQADIAVFLVAHQQFSNIHAEHRDDKVIIDTVGIWR